MTAEVRVASIESDLDALVELNISVQALHMQAEPEKFRLPPKKMVSGWFRDVLDQDGWTALLAEEDGRPVGYVLYEIVDRAAGTFTNARRSAYIHQIGVTPAARRRGVGRDLLNRVEEEAATLGIDHVALDTWAFNDSAMAFFHDVGFEAHRIQLRRPVRGEDR